MFRIAVTDEHTDSQKKKGTENEEVTQKEKRWKLLEIVIPVSLLMPVYYFDHSLATTGLTALCFYHLYSFAFSRRAIDDFGIRISGIRESFWDTRYLFLLGFFLVFPISIIIETQLPPLDGFASSFLNNPYGYVISALVVSPPIEEFVFRGVLQKRLGWYTPNFLANILTSLAFVMIHWIPGELWVISTIMALRFIRSLLYGQVFAKTQNIVHSWTIHMVFNLFEPVITIVLLISGLIIV